jgi:hypothetical protein
MIPDASPTPVYRKTDPSEMKSITTRPAITIQNPNDLLVDHGCCLQVRVSAYTPSKIEP